MKRIYAITLMLLACPVEGGQSVSNSEVQAIPKMAAVEMPPFWDKVWESQDFEMVVRALDSGDAELLKYFKIKLGNAPADEFKKRITIPVLRAPDTFWNSIPPSTGSGTINFAARRAVCEVLLENLDEANLTVDDIADPAIRKVMADKLEAQIGKESPPQNSKGVDNPQGGVESNHEAFAGGQDPDADKNNKLIFLLVGAFLLLVSIHLIQRRKGD